MLESDINAMAVAADAALSKHSYVTPETLGAANSKSRVRASEAGVHLDYFTQKQAAAYCGVSINHFRDQAPLYGIRPFPFMGKLRYRREDLKSVQEDAWQQSASGATRSN